MSESFVRFATQADDDAIFSHLIELHRDNALFRRIPYSRESCYRTIWAATQPQRLNPPGPLSFIGVIDAPDGSGLAASCCIQVANWWWSDRCGFLMPLWTFVVPRWRRGYRFDEWLVNWMAECRARMADDIAFGGDLRPFLLESSFGTDDRVEAKSRLWRRLWRKFGGKKIGEVWLIGL